MINVIKILQRRTLSNYVEEIVFKRRFLVVFLKVTISKLSVFVLQIVSGQHDPKQTSNYYSQSINNL